MDDETSYYTGDESLYKRALAELSESNAALCRAKDENSKLMKQNEDLNKQQMELRGKIKFLEGQIEAYQYCMNCRR